MPATMAPAFPIERSDLSVTFSLIRNTNPLNLLGVPAISVPCGFTESGLPIGLQLAGRWWDEAAVLRAAFAYEQASDWRLSTASNRGVGRAPFACPVPWRAGRPLHRLRGCTNVYM
jgi:Asp-tRNA(Asn)/Glu-tRNA(Gln) amidotransferase A subunit family amidase